MRLLLIFYIAYLDETTNATKCVKHQLYTCSLILIVNMRLRYIYHFLTYNSAFHPFLVKNLCNYVDYEGTWRQADQGCVWLFGCGSKSRGHGLRLRPIGCTPALSVTQQHMLNVMLLHFYLTYCVIMYGMTIRVTYIAPHLRTPVSAVSSSPTGPPFSLGRSRPSPHTRTLTCTAIQPHVFLVCRLNDVHLRNQ